MIRKKMWRYYCEHCKKASCSGGHMAWHEKSCTANPQRVCRMCGDTSKQAGNRAEMLRQGYSLEWLRDETEGCPACMLAAIRQSKLQGFDEEGGFRFDFDFKEEKARWWSEKNEDAEQRAAYYY